MLHPNIVDIGMLMVQQDPMFARLRGGNKELQNIICRYSTSFNFCGQTDENMAYQMTLFNLMDIVTRLIICWEYPDADMIAEIMMKAAPSLIRLDLCMISQHVPTSLNILNVSNPMSNLRELVLLDCELRISWLPHNLVDLDIRRSTIAFEDINIFGRLESLRELILEGVDLKFGNEGEPLEEPLQLPIPPALQVLEIVQVEITSFRLGRGMYTDRQIFMALPVTLQTLVLSEPFRGEQSELACLTTLDIREPNGFWCEESTDLRNSIGNVTNVDLILEVSDGFAFHDIDIASLLSKLSSLDKLQTLSLHSRIFSKSSQANAMNIIGMLQSNSLERLEMRGWAHEGEVQNILPDPYKGRLPKLISLSFIA
jgi:hypothetical protein